MAATGRLILAQSKEKFLTAQPPKGLALYLLSTNKGLFYEMHGVLWGVLLQTGVSTLMLNFVKWELDAVSSRGGGDPVEICSKEREGTKPKGLG